MGRDLTESVSPICLETDARNILRNTLQPLLVALSSLTLVLLAGDVVAACERGSLHDAQSALDAVEHMTLAGVRRTDMVVRCAANCCALVLMGAQTEGALCVINRLRRRMEGWNRGGYSLLIGLAAAPAQATEVDGLIELACRSSARLVPPEEEGDTTWDVLGTMELPDVLTLPRLEDESSRRHTVIRQFELDRQPSPEPELTVHRRKLSRQPRRSLPPAAFVQARARALGIPYLALPQQIPSSVRNLLPQEVMQQLQCLPIGRDRNSLTVALADPTDSGVLRQLEQITGMTIFPVMTDPDVLKSLAQPAHSRRVSRLSSTSVSQASR